MSAVRIIYQYDKNVSSWSKQVSIKIIIKGNKMKDYDRLEELKKLIKDYYFSKGYEFDSGLCSINVHVKLVDTYIIIEVYLLEINPGVGCSSTKVYLLMINLGVGCSSTKIFEHCRNTEINIFNDAFQFFTIKKRK